MQTLHMGGCRLAVLLRLLLCFFYFAYVSPHNVHDPSSCSLLSFFSLFLLWLALRKPLHIWPGLDWCPVSEEVGHPQIPCHLHGILCVICRIMLLGQIRITKNICTYIFPSPLLLPGLRKGCFSRALTCNSASIESEGLSWRWLGQPFLL